MKIIDATIQDVFEIELISDQVFGQGYYSKSNIIFSNYTINLVSLVNDKIVGFAIGFITSENYLIGLDCPEEVLVAAQNHKLGIIKTIAVSEKFQGQRIGKFLFSTLEQRLEDLGATNLIVPAWKVENKIYLESILNKFNYKSFHENMPWKNICDYGSYKCLLRKDKCVCSSVYYYK